MMGSFWRRLKEEIQKKTRVNYIYFGFFLFFLCFLSAVHFLYTQNAFLSIRLFFLFYALGQACLEVCFFVLVGHLLKRFCPLWMHHLFIGTLFLLLGIHFADFTLIQLMDTSIRYAFQCLFGCGVSHFLATVQSLHLNTTMACIVGLSFLCIPLVGILLYKMTGSMIRRTPWETSLGQLTNICVGLIVALLGLNLLVSPFLQRSSYDQYAKALPLGSMFFAPTPQHILLPHNPLSFSMTTPLPLYTTPEQPLPNIYIWVIESLRRDFIQEEIAPHLTTFGATQGTFTASFANANATHLSWFAIFHSLFPYHWTGVRDQTHAGSVPLQILKQLGYKIKVYSSADLRYYNMDQLLFGENRQLLEHIQEFSSQWNLKPYQRDQAVLTALCQDLAQDDSSHGQVYLLFLDATHSEYSFPEEGPLQFIPIAKEIDYLTISHTKKDLEPLKNRYRNAIHYVDQLIGTFVSFLEKKGLFQDSICVITGDHGEEFFEEGALFHGTHLNTMQTSIPLFCKLPQGPLPSQQTASHVDIFPTILHTLLGEKVDLSCFDGHSLWYPQPHPHLLTVMQNGAQTPYEFTLQTNEMNIHARFVNPQSIYSEPRLELISFSLQTDEHPQTDSVETLIQNYCPTIFDPILGRVKQ